VEKTEEDREGVLAIEKLRSLSKKAVTRLDVTSEFPVAPVELARIKHAVKRFSRLEWISWPEL